jgi:hypothetical protein
VRWVSSYKIAYCGNIDKGLVAEQNTSYGQKSKEKRYRYRTEQLIWTVSQCKENGIVTKQNS